MLQHRECKRSRFTGSGLSNTEEIMFFQQERNGLALDGSRCFIAGLMEVFENKLMELQIMEF